MVQQPLHAQPIEESAVLRELAALEVVDQADRREHQRVVGQVPNIRVDLDAFHDAGALGRPFPAGLLGPLILRQADRRAPVTRVLGDLSVLELLEVALREVQGPECSGRVSDRARREKVTAARICLA
jgi:hypothetical protein